jgi:hypothetical protein
MFTIEHTTREFLDALERLNKKQNEKNVFTNISDQDVFREIARYRNINRASRTQSYKEILSSNLVMPEESSLPFSCITKYKPTKKNPVKIRAE